MDSKSTADEPIITEDRATASSSNNNNNNNNHHNTTTNTPQQTTTKRISSELSEDSDELKTTERSSKRLFLRDSPTHSPNTEHTESPIASSSPPAASEPTPAPSTGALSSSSSYPSSSSSSEPSQPTTRPVADAGAYSAYSSYPAYPPADPAYSAAAPAYPVDPTYSAYSAYPPSSYSDYYYGNMASNNNNSGAPAASNNNNNNGAPPTQESPDAPRSTDLSLRSIISISNVGPIIGRGGANINYFREQTNCKIRISDAAPGATERILTIDGELNGVAKAYMLIYSKLHEESLLPGSAYVKPVLRLLVPHAQVGSIIGKGGANIRQIQESSGARVSVSEEVMPNSTERCVTVSGTPEEVHLATTVICQKLCETPLPPTILPYQPAVSYNYPSQYHGYGPNYARNSNYPESTPYPAYPPQSQQITVPNELIGCIIGRGGSKISEIRQHSGAQVRISEAIPGGIERVVTVTGSSECIQAAMYMLYREMEAERTRIANRQAAR